MGQGSPAFLRWLAAAASPPHPRSPCSAPPPRGQGLGAERGREGPGKTTQIALQWARPPGGAGSPEPPPRGAFAVPGSQVLGSAWAREVPPGGDAGLEAWWPTPGGPERCDDLEEGQCRAADRGGESGLSRSGSPAPPVLCGLWYSD